MYSVACFSNPLAISQLETGQSLTGAISDSHYERMKMLKYLGSVIAFLVIAFDATAAEKPNIILFFTDDHGWPDIGAASVNDDLKTLHLDALAALGVHATNGYVTAPQCVPSRGGAVQVKAIPEPATLSLLGLSVLTLFRRRK